MRNKLKCILIIAFSICFISCAFGKETKNDIVPEKEINNQDSNEKADNKGAEVDDKESGSEVEESKENRVVAGSKKKIIYLTFDDGPSYKVTNNVLDILKENKVKATFFLIGNQIKGKEGIVKRIYNEGNGIGLHSYTHNYKKIYNNEDNFIHEMFDCRKEINRAVGISPNIIRFPGGSYQHLSKKFINRLHDNKLKVYDWNQDNCDGLRPKTSSEELYAKAIEGSENKERIILLLHCTDAHQNTFKALPKIIKYYKSHGYEFRVITEDTKELHSPIKQ